MKQNKDLRKAAEDGNLGELKQALEKGADVNAKTQDGMTLLMDAARDGDTTFVQELLAQKGIEVNAKNDNGITALMFAATWRQTKIVKLLLAAGADVNAQDKDRNTALKLAFGRPIGDKKVVPDIVDLLLRYKAIPEDEETTTRLKEYRTWRFLDRAGKMLMGAGLVGMGLSIAYANPIFGLVSVIAFGSAALLLEFGTGDFRPADKMQVQASTTSPTRKNEVPSVESSVDVPAEKAQSPSGKSENRQQSKSM